MRAARRVPVLACLCSVTFGHRPHRGGPPGARLRATAAHPGAVARAAVAALGRLWYSAPCSSAPRWAARLRRSALRLVPAARSAQLSKLLRSPLRPRRTWGPGGPLLAAAATMAPHPLGACAAAGRPPSGRAPLPAACRWLGRRRGPRGGASKAPPRGLLSGAGRSAEGVIKGAVFHIPKNWRCPAGLAGAAAWRRSGRAPARLGAPWRALGACLTALYGL